ncbi:hypothetical protein MKK88_21525 [Methylobacterium sp. E-005]|uniref:hypothetical protein n=1 Tax=Methylobacterium sp. E-005 TaxID=2836549 RepID=UPI001FB8941C|nr:hypothetical protein [Methylobacterium sp. E-005]MCJ2088538.1 hypothetical protein [Methylobacterium sp. E-005]
MTDLVLLIDAACLLYGEDWQRPLARGLGRLHPDGHREDIDDRLVRRWASGERSVPTWVGPALVRLLRRHASLAAKRSFALKDAATDLGARLAPEPEPDLGAPEPHM